MVGDGAGYSEHYRESRLGACILVEDRQHSVGVQTDCVGNAVSLIV